jgi:hypothetical protein
MVVSKVLLAETQVLLRKVNEGIKNVEPWSRERRKRLFTCECSQRACDRLVKLSLTQYEAVRAYPDRFVIARGHETPGIERVVAEHGRFTVVEKLGAAADVARTGDPRHR